MNPFDKIIGYESIRKELERTADALKNPEYYSRIGVSAPCGLMLYGEPGLGKTLMAECLIEASGRRSFVCRKNMPDGKFVNEIKRTFDLAKKEAPSIILLDDLDKFANDDDKHPDSEEYVTVQSCIDEMRGSGVFVLATANKIFDLPRSLLRSGRFDRTIEVDPPNNDDAVRIVRHYLESKSCVEGIDADAVAGAMSGRSCADLEAAVNKAGLLAGFERSEKITMRHLMLGCLDVAHDVSPDSIVAGKDDKAAVITAYHEAGHALVSETLFPGSVYAVCLFEAQNSTAGFTSYNMNDAPNLENKLGIATRSLGGRAATMQKFGITDVGSSEDVLSAHRDLFDLTVSDAAFGFDLIDGMYETSGEILTRQHLFIASKMDECLNAAKRIVTENAALLDAIAKELLEKGLLTARDVQRIKSGVPA